MPADEAGIKGAYRNSRGEIALGDVITHINDKPVRSNDDYLSVLEEYEIGDIVTVRTRRGDEDKRFEVTLSESQ